LTIIKNRIGSGGIDGFAGKFWPEPKLSNPQPPGHPCNQENASEARRAIQVALQTLLDIIKSNKHINFKPIFILACSLYPHSFEGVAFINIVEDMENNF